MSSSRERPSKEAAVVAMTAMMTGEAPSAGGGRTVEEGGSETPLR
eukprot:CAMPEP_0115285364 /NCGR_PEP_ID=MMETSP0270-20121206/61385_1 /TAXON_ID=71861 /ORGANISM="Scrippsiella trochoidea, Strain CCMP3099" /LENGTH=44 /DNA_ID= /DNA_START= /DNA_END= /DNA_ORIENTATION=